MVRACCVLDCSSGKSVPSHTFPKDTERRNKWFQNLYMRPLEKEEEIKKLRVCHKHFREEDYSGSSTRRVLLYAAIPFVNMPQHEIEVADKNITADVAITDLIDARCAHEEQEQEQNEEQDQHQNEEQHQQDQGQQQDQRQQEQISLLDKESFILAQEGKNQKILEQQQIELQRHKEILMEQQQEITQIKETLNMQKKQLIARPNLEEVTRKILLSPKAKKFYEQIVKMKKEKRYLKRLINKCKKQHVAKSIQLSITNHKGKVDTTAHVRQQFINMIARNNDIAPQVNSKTSP